MNAQIPYKTVLHAGLPLRVLFMD